MKPQENENWPGQRHSSNRKTTTNNTKTKILGKTMKSHERWIKVNGMFVYSCVWANEFWAKTKMAKDALSDGTYLITKLLDYRSTGAFVVQRSFSGCYLHCCMRFLSLQLHCPRNYCCCYYYWYRYYRYCCCCCYCYYSASRSAVKRWSSIWFASNHCQNVNYPIACVAPKPLSPSRAGAQSPDTLALMNRTPGFQNKHTRTHAQRPSKSANR